MLIIPIPETNISLSLGGSGNSEMGTLSDHAVHTHSAAQDQV